MSESLRVSLKIKFSLVPSVGRFFLTLLIGILVEMCAGGMGVAICSVRLSLSLFSLQSLVQMAPSYAVAVSITGPLLTVLSLSGGLFTNVDSIPVWIGWVQYISW